MLADDKVFIFHLYFLFSIDIGSVCKRERNSVCIDLFEKTPQGYANHSFPAAKIRIGCRVQKFESQMFFAEEALSLSLIQLSWHPFFTPLFFIFSVFSFIKLMMYH